MLTIADVRRWQPSLLDASFDQLKTHRDTLLRLQDELWTAGNPPDWSGDAATAAAESSLALNDRMEHLVGGLAAVQRAVGEAADAVIGLQHAITEADSLAGPNGFQIRGDGQIVEVWRPDPMSEEVYRERGRLLAELFDRVEQILRRAADIDADLAGVLDKARRGEIGDDATSLADAASDGDMAGQLSTVEPPQGGTPADNAGWWDTLSDEEQRWIIEQRPDLIGNLDGIPAAARDEANRARIDAEWSALKDLEAQLMRELADNTFGGTFSNADAGLEQVQEKLRSIDKIRDVISQPDRQLLVLDMSNERAEAAVAVGNLDTADHVAVFTPGLTTTVNGNLGGYDTDMENLRQKTLDQLHDAGRPNETVATVSWIGYQAPQWGETFGENSVVGSGAAEHGANKLAPFLNGIDASRDTDPHLTALGHSYGSTTTGYALQHGTGVDDAVFFGSPGLGTEDVRDLKIPDGHANYIEGRLDPVGDFGRFGDDPSSMPGMNQLSAKDANGPSGPMTESAWHSYYLHDNSTSQYNMAAVIAGLPDNTIHDR